MYFVLESINKLKYYIDKCVWFWSSIFIEFGFDNGKNFGVCLKCGILCVIYYLGFVF